MGTEGETSVYQKHLGGSLRSGRLRTLLKALRLLVACLYLVVIGLAIYLIILLADRAPLAFRSSNTERHSQLARGADEGAIPPGTWATSTNSPEKGEVPESALGNKGSSIPTRQSRVSQSRGNSSPQSRGSGDGLQRSTSRPAVVQPAEGANPEGESSFSVELGSGSLFALRQVSKELLPVLQRAREALQQHDTGSAWAELHQALEKFPDPLDQAKVRRWLELCRVLDEFWRVMGGVVSGLQPTHTIPVGDTEVIVVESSEKELTIKAAGRVVTFSLRRIPPPLVKELALKAFRQDPQSKIVLAVYLAIEPKGDREKSRQLLLEAMAAGFDPGDMILELPAFFDPQSLGDFLEADSPVERQRVVASTSSHEGLEGTSSPQEPSEAERSAKSPEWRSALQKIRESYAGEFEAATNPAAKSRLGRQLLDAARSKPEDHQMQQALLSEVRRLAVEAGDVELVLGYLEAEARRRRIDRTRETLAALQEIAGIHTRAEVHRELAQAALKAAVDAVQVYKFAEANQLLDLAITSGRKGGNRTLVEEAMAAKKNLQMLQRR